MSGDLHLATVSTTASSLPASRPFRLPLLLLLLLCLTGALPVDAARAGDLARVTLFGGPGTVEGRFEDAFGQPAWNGWTSVDLTEEVDGPYWQVSSFNAATLGDHGSGNHAMWCGQDASQQSGWSTPPGYGNDWDAALEWRSGPLSDPSVGRTVELDFLFHHDLEPNYDHLRVRYFRGGEWVEALTVTGTDATAGVFDAPGRRYSDLATVAITYAGDDYATGSGGGGTAEIVLQILVASDQSHSDADGLFDSTAGAAQVDDVHVRVPDGGAWIETFDDFEGDGPHAWVPAPPRVVGDFAKILADLSEPDPCVENPTPQATFIDDGTPPNNVPGVSTGGSTSPLIDYGTPGGWTINITGGVSGEDLPLRNEVRSPPIALDAPGPEDDGPGWRPVLSFRVWGDNTGYSPGYQVRVRSSEDGVDFGPWADLVKTVFFVPGSRRYLNAEFDLASALSPTDAWVQIALGPLDLAHVPRDHATPGPWFDDVQLVKVRTGTAISAFERGRPADAFPVATGLDVSTPTARDALDVRFDGAWLNRSDRPEIRLDPLDGSTTPQAVRMVWILEQNPLFENALRNLPAGSTLLSGTGTLGGARWAGAFDGVAGAAADLWAFDVPDVDFLYPGDVLRVHYEVVSSDGVISTLPTSLDGFEDGLTWPEPFTLRALPTLLDAAGTTPPILVIEHRDSGVDFDEPVVAALRQNGLRPGLDFDVFRGRGFDPDLLDAGARLEHLGGYSILLVSDATFSDLTLGPALPLLDAWVQEPGDRHTLWVGDRLVAELQGFDAFLDQRLGLVVDGVLDPLGDHGTRRPVALPQDPRFEDPFVVDVGCAGRLLTALQPTAASTVGHRLARDATGMDFLPDAVASIVHERVVPAGHRIDVVLPFALRRVGTPMDPRSTVGAATAPSGLEDEMRDRRDTIEVHHLQPRRRDAEDVGSSAGSEPPASATLVSSAAFPGRSQRPGVAPLPGAARLSATAPSAAARLLGEVLALFGGPAGVSTSTAPPISRTLSSVSVHPNPFNPRTTVGFATGQEGWVRVRIFDLRGALVRELFSGRRPAGEHALMWDGRDDQGRALGSGVYLVDVRAAGERRTLKVALLR